MTILAKIVEEKRRELALLPPHSVGADDLRAALKARGPARDFLTALRKPKSGSVALIAEVKRASPSAGMIRPDFDPVAIAKQFELAGADCLSVLTDEKFFQGSLKFLKEIRQAIELPLLRKDFIIDSRQILQAIQWGTDAILLIAAILTDEQLNDFHRLATGAGLAALVEVHDEIELERALAIDAELIGVNNRDLKSFNVDLSTTERLAARLHSSRPNTRSSIILVAESGIHARTDVERLARSGANAILVGEALMKHGDPKAKVREFLGDYH